MAEGNPFDKIWKDIKSLVDIIAEHVKNPATVTPTYLLIVLVIMLFLAGIASLSYPIMFYMYYIDSKLKKNPLNHESPEYMIINACSLRGSHFKYILFPVISVASIIMMGFILYQLMNSKQETSNAQIMELMFVVPLAIILIFVLLVYLYIFFSVRNTMSQVQRNIAMFNNSVATNIYPPVMKMLTTIPNNSVEALGTITKVLKSYKPSGSSAKTNEELARIFFTCNLYQHYLKMGIDNYENLADCMSNVFNTTNLMRYKMAKIHKHAWYKSWWYMFRLETSISKIWCPADYLDRKYTFIEDFSDNYVSILKSPASKNKNLKKVNLVAVSSLCSAMTQDASYYANRFSFQDAFYAFVVLVATTAVVFMLPFVYGGKKLYRYYYPVTPAEEAAAAAKEEEAAAAEEAEEAEEEEAAVEEEEEKETETPKPKEKEKEEEAEDTPKEEEKPKPKEEEKPPKGKGKGEDTPEPKEEEKPPKGKGKGKDEDKEA